MSIDRSILTSAEVYNIISKPEIINSVRVCTNRAAGTITWPGTGDLKNLVKLILNEPGNKTWLDAILYYVVNNNPQIDWEHYGNFITTIEPEIYNACKKAIYEICGETIPGEISVITEPDDLDETNLNGAILHITLLYDFFVDSTLDSSNFTLLNAPDGVTVASVTYLCERRADVVLAFDGTDMDDECPRTRMQLKIAAAEVDSNADIVSNTITVTPVNESVAITTNPVSLTEGNLDGAQITLTLTDETFADTLSAANFTLTNAPTGVTKTVTRVSDTVALLTLAFDGTDFSADVTNFSVTVQGSELTRGNSLTTPDITITALNESVAISTTPGSLTEGNLNGASITLTLTNETFADTLNAANFTLTNAPTGVTKTVTRVSDTIAVLTLAFDGTDFDADITNFSVTVQGSELTRGNSLTTPDITISSLIESVAISTTPGSLTEGNLNGASITLTLTNETFADTLNAANFTLTNAPTGLTKMVTRLSDTIAVLTLAFDGTDFDTDITNFSVTVQGSELTRGNSLTSPDITIVSIDESATLTPIPDPLVENILNSASAKITLSGDVFVNAMLNPANFTLNNAPAGLSIASVNLDSDTMASIEFDFDGTDFDTDVTNFSITIASAELGKGSLTTNDITIFAVIE